MSVRVQIAIAEPSVIIRSGIISVLKRLPTLNINIFEVTDISYINTQLCKWKPDILIVNPSFPGAFPLSNLKNDLPCKGLKFVAIHSSLIDPSILKAYDETISIHDTAEQIQDKLTTLCSLDDEPPEGNKQELSAREKEIIVCVVKGMINKQIAEHLCLSTHTVITHRRNIANKLQIHSPAGLTIYAIVNKLVELNDVKDLGVVQK
jgi:DNA-binding NarL/FixJ family response regulator